MTLVDLSREFRVSKNIIAEIIRLEDIARIIKFARLSRVGSGDQEVKDGQENQIN